MRFLLIFILVGVGSYVSAQEYTEKTGYVVNIFADYSIIKVQICDESKNCSKFFYEPNTDITKTFLPILLSAKAMNNKVWAFGKTSPNSEWPYNNYNKLSSLDLIDESKEDN